MPTTLTPTQAAAYRDMIALIKEGKDYADTHETVAQDYVLTQKDARKLQERYDEEH